MKILKLILVSTLICISFSSFNSIKENIKPLCPVNWTFNSTITLDQGSVDCLGLHDEDYSFTTWSDHFNISGFPANFKISFTVDFPPNNPAGTLTLSVGGSTLSSLSVPYNSAPVTIGYNAAECFDQFTIDFN